ncbi:MAG: TetR/AcrR family transcriptional regulator [Clostridium sp.]|jgi:AcrR family transcriptional regulator|nr:TetR/AcrR family transcriptional regulator [Clostridium sp.]
MNTKPENQRIRLSKALLKNALIELLWEKNIEKISIYELCDRAQINRTTFYKYYGDQYALLEDIENDWLLALERHFSFGQAQDLVALTNVLEYLESERDKFRVLFNSSLEKEFSLKLFNLPTVVSTLNLRFLEDRPEHLRNYIYIFVCQGCYAVIRQWLNDDIRAPAGEIAELLQFMLNYRF